MSERKSFARSESVRRFTYCAVSVALAIVTSMITLYRFPFGGSVTLFSMLFIILPGWLYGVKYGVVTGLLVGIINFVIQPCFLTIPQFFLDYILAFSIMGIAGVWTNTRKNLMIGYGVAVLGRWVVATIAGLVWVSLGYTAWDGWSPLPYSMAYNGAYIFTEAILTYLILVLPPVKKGLEWIKKH